MEGRGILSSLFNWENAALVMSSVNSRHKARRTNDERQPQNFGVGQMTMNKAEFGYIPENCYISTLMRKENPPTNTISTALPRKILTDDGQGKTDPNFKVEFLDICATIDMM